MSGKIEIDANQEFETSSTGLTGMLNSIIDAGRGILNRRRQATAEAPSEDLLVKCRQLLHHRGEASGLALACEIIASFQSLDKLNKIIFFEALANDFGADSKAILVAADRYRTEPTAQNLADLSRATDSYRIKLFRRMNMAPNATSLLVKMRGTLLSLLPEHPDLKSVEVDLKHQFVSWFNRGFLELKVIDWNSPASVLEKIIEYESVHAIQGWDDLRSRLRDNRMCFAFFHPAMPDDPLVFVEVALTNGVPSAIAPLIDKTSEPVNERAIDTVVFYSISNCHPGLAGVSFGNFLIKHVVEEVGKRYPNTKRYVTLSPVPGFCRWLTAQKAHADLDELRALAKDQGRDTTDPLWESLVRLCAQYLSSTRDNNLAIDPVARFHLGNGASLHAIHWAADVSEKGLNQSIGIMVNYLYDLSSIEENHDAYFDQGEIAMSRTVAKWLH
jgi:malonyl-CoA decarboxylase